MTSFLTISGPSLLATLAPTPDKSSLKMTFPTSVAAASSKSSLTMTSSLTPASPSLSLTPTPASTLTPTPGNLDSLSFTIRLLASFLGSNQLPSSSSSSIKLSPIVSHASYSSSSSSLASWIILHRFSFTLASSSLSSVLLLNLMFSSFDNLFNPYFLFFSLTRASLSLFSSSRILSHSSILRSLHLSDFSLMKDIASLIKAQLAVPFLALSILSPSILRLSLASILFLSMYSISLLYLKLSSSLAFLTQVPSS